MAISAKDVMELRKQTDCGMMECKKALTEADGNFEKAIEILRERGLATAAKKASRVAAEGMVYADYCPKCKVGVVIEVNAETGFVAKNDKFVDFVKEATKVVMLFPPLIIMLCVTFTALVQRLIAMVKAISTAASVSIPAGETTWGAVFIANGLQLILAVLLIVLGLNIVFHSFSAYKKAEHNSEAKI